MKPPPTQIFWDVISKFETVGLYILNLGTTKLKVSGTVADSHTHKWLLHIYASKCTIPQTMYKNDIRMPMFMLECSGNNSDLRTA